MTTLALGAAVPQTGEGHACSDLALQLHAQEQWAAAAEACEKALQLEPPRDAVRIAYGDCLLRLKRIEEALACFELCSPDAARPQALFGKAVALQLLRRFDQAEDLYQRLAAAGPHAEEALSNLIAMSMEVFDLTRVERYSLQLLAVSAQSRAALQGLVLVAVERREYEAAARCFTLLAEHHPEILAARRAEAGDGAPIEYRLSRELLDRLDLDPELWTNRQGEGNGTAARPH